MVPGGGRAFDLVAERARMGLLGDAICPSFYLWVPGGTGYYLTTVLTPL